MHTDSSYLHGQREDSDGIDSADRGSVALLNCHSSERLTIVVEIRNRVKVQENQ